MYLGIRSHYDAKRVASYEQARAALERASRTPTGKARTEKLYGFHLGLNRNHGVTWVRENEDKSIAFRLYATDVVVWHPDNSVDIDNYGTITTSGFAEQFLPRGIHLYYPSTRRGVTGGANTIGFLGRSDEGETVHAICQGDVVRFNATLDGRWTPDHDTLYDLEFPVRTAETIKAGRELGKRYHLRDFEAWLSTAPAHLDAGGSRIVHIEWSLDECLEALEARHFRPAAEYLPLIKDDSAYGRELKPLPITTWPNDQVVTMGSLAKLKLAILSDRGAIDTITAKTLSRKEFDKHMALVRALTALGVEDRGWGPQ